MLLAAVPELGLWFGSEAAGVVHFLGVVRFLKVAHFEYRQLLKSLIWQSPPDYPAYTV